MYGKIELKRVLGNQKNQHVTTEATLKMKENAVFFVVTIFCGLNSHKDKF